VKFHCARSRSIHLSDFVISLRTHQAVFGNGVVPRTMKTSK
jgi:hypothetical protein